ncbi:GNAT family N-acetyltransferase [Pandoraea horticolens]|uniref:GNAT family N-acetyltransferase n=1 Tax=Pandoraea horticolens TaxID=2508298 RepID=A0A5E4XMG6_9BURK|nr:GNAT family protein [Pandoraea horticolens]VVE37517.1 GNAT family N-acetyltransferase [Pandoraea horticolens]
MRINVAPNSEHPDVSLRQLERSDASDWYAYLALPEVFEHTSWNLESSEDLLPMFDAFDSTSADSVRRLAIVDSQSLQLVGTIGFHTVSSANRTAEIAYDLAPSHWGRGIASAVCDAVTRWSFFTYGFVRVQATVLRTNSRSESVLRRCHFQREGLLRSYRMVRGTPGDFLLYSRLPTESR